MAALYVANSALYRATLHQSLYVSYYADIFGGAGGSSTHTFTLCSRIMRSNSRSGNSSSRAICLKKNIQVADLHTRPDQSSPRPPPLHFLKIHFNIILPSTPRCFKWSFPQVSPPKSCIHLSSLPYVLYAPLISFFSI